MNLSLEDEEEECPELIPPPADDRKHSFVSWLSLLKAVLRNPEGFIPDPATSVPDPTKIVPDLTKIILNICQNCSTVASMPKLFYSYHICQN